MISSIWLHDFHLKSILVYKLHAAFLPNLLRPSFNFIAFKEVAASSKELHTRKHFQKNPCNHIRHQCPENILNVSFQMNL